MNKELDVIYNDKAKAAKFNAVTGKKHLEQLGTCQQKGEWHGWKGKNVCLKCAEGVEMHTEPKVPRVGSLRAWFMTRGQGLAWGIAQIQMSRGKVVP